MMRSRIRWGRLRTKIIAWFLVPTAIILGAVALFTFATYQLVTEELVAERNQEITYLLSDALVAQFLEIYAGKLTALVTGPDLYQAEPDAWEDSIRQAGDRLSAFDGGVVVLDSTGTVIAADPGRPDALGEVWSQHAFFRRILESAGGVALSDVLPVGPGGDDVVALSVPLPGREGTIVGLCSLAAGTNQNSMLRSANRVLGGLIREGQVVYLVDGSGRVVYSGGGSGAQLGETLAGQETVDRVINGEADAIRTQDRSGQGIIASFSPLRITDDSRNRSALGLNDEDDLGHARQALSPVGKQSGLASPSMTTDVNAGPKYGTVSTNWGLVIEESWAEVTSTSQLYGRWLLGLLAMGVLVPAAVIAVGSRQVTRPIATFSQVAQAMAEGDLDQEINVQTGDELEALAAQFNRMSAQLRGSYATLEQRVDDRTRELTTLNAIAEVVSRSLDLQQVLRAALDKTMEATGMEVGAAYRLEEDGETLALIAHQGLSDALVSHLARLPLRAGAAGRAAREERPVVLAVSDYPDDTLKAHLEAKGLTMAVSVPLMAKGRALGAISLGSHAMRQLPPEELSLLAAIGQQTGLAVENASLYEHAEESAAAAERNRLARDLHDAVTQTLFSAALIAEVLPRIWERRPDEGLRRLDELRELTRGALAEMRTLLLELRPSALVEVPLGDLLRQLAESITGRARIPVALEIVGDCTLPVEIKVAFYRIAQEALNNMAKHAGASAASVSLRCQAQRVALRVRDDGCGFDAANISLQSLGVGIMRERAQAIGADLEIESAPGEGTQVAATWSRSV